MAVGYCHKMDVTHRDLKWVDHWKMVEVYVRHTPHVFIIHPYDSGWKILFLSRTKRMLSWSSSTSGSANDTQEAASSAWRLWSAHLTTWRPKCLTNRNRTLMWVHCVIELITLSTFRRRISQCRAWPHPKYDLQKCDVWSLGVILYMMLTGTPPFSGEDEATILGNVRRNNISYRRQEWEAMAEAEHLVRNMIVSDRPSCSCPPCHAS